VRRSVIAFLHSGNTQTHTHTGLFAAPPDRAVERQPAVDWHHLSLKLCSFFHTQVEKRSSPKPATATVYPRKRKKKAVRYLSLFASAHLTPQILI